MRILYGLVKGEFVPETAAEIEKLGEKKYFARVQLVEVLPVPEFDGSILGKLSSSPLIEQYNVADRAQSQIDRFLGLFKILEDCYGPKNSHFKLADALKTSQELFTLASNLRIRDKNTGVVTDLSDKKSYDELMVKLVKMRHECAHLSRSKNFGITHGDFRIKSWLEPLLPALRALAFLTVDRQD